MIYTVRGTDTVDEWVRRTLDDWETSAIEGHLGTWMEEVARIVSGGVKPGSGVDLQIDRPEDPPVTELYAGYRLRQTRRAPAGGVPTSSLCGAPRPLCGRAGGMSRSTSPCSMDDIRRTSWKLTQT